MICCTDDPQDAQVARQYLSTPEEFAATAKFWTESYASSEPGVDAKVRGPVSVRGTPRPNVPLICLRCPLMSAVGDLWIVIVRSSSV